jgi:hypothetical protein
MSKSGIFCGKRDLITHYLDQHVQIGIIRCKTEHIAALPTKSVYSLDSPAHTHTHTHTHPHTHACTHCATSRDLENSSLRGKIPFYHHLDRVR